MAKRKETKFGWEFTEKEKKDFKKIINAIFNELERKGYNIEKKVFADGYLLQGDHYIYKLWLKECPGWIFGIWLDQADDYDNDLGETAKNYYRLQVFAQYEKDIDKFKPSATMVCYETYIYKEGLNKTDEFSEYSLDKYTKIMDYVKDQPYLAWYRNANYIDYNLEYISPSVAKREFLKSEKHHKLEKEFNEMLWKAQKAFLQGFLEGEEVKYKICDDGEYCWPRGHIVIEDPDIEKEGCYSFMTDEEWEVFEKATIEKIKKKAEKKGIYLYTHFDNFAIFKHKIKGGKNV